MTSMSAHDTVGQLAEFIGTLAKAHHPDIVAQAIACGPGALFGAKSAAVLAARPPRLVVLGLHGYREVEVAGLEFIDLHGDFPLARACRESAVIIDDPRTVADRYSGMRREGTRWPLLRERLPEGSIVSAPIISAGRAIGAYAINCSEPHEWSPADYALLDCMSHALGLWMTHSSSGLPETSPGAPTPELTLRQRTILEGVIAGMTNAGIATSLGCSESTVRQELRRIARQLDTTSRGGSASRAVELGLVEGRSS